MEKALYRETLAYLCELLPGKSSLSIEEVASFFDVDRKTAYSWVRRVRNPLPIIPTGGRCMRVSIPALANWMCSDGRRC